MGGKMNWERVRKENLARLHGSDWVEVDPLLVGATAFVGTPTFADSPLANKNKKTKKSKKKKLRHPKMIIPLAARMVGCTCGKSTGFIGLHKKRCPLCGTAHPHPNALGQEPASGTNHSPTPEDYARLKAKIDKLEAELLLRKRKCDVALP